MTLSVTTSSMTAFAREEASTVSGELTWELRSVNHRYLETSFRIPDDTRRFETRFREIIGQKCQRGRIDATLRIKSSQPDPDDIAIDESTLLTLKAMSRNVSDVLPDLMPLRIADVLAWPGVIRQKEVDPEALARATSDLLAATLDELLIARQREGGRLASIIGERLDASTQIVANVRQALPEIAQAHRERLQTRVQEIIEQVDPDRLEQEMVLFLQRSDVDEELDRLSTHIDEVKRVLGTDKPKGRRLDFLMQELNREANTLGSKSVDTRMTAASVDLKVLIEQMREQIQNIE